VDALDTFKAAQREGWAHFAPLEMMTTIPAARLVKFAGVRSGQRVLDVDAGQELWPSPRRGWAHR